MTRPLVRRVVATGLPFFVLVQFSASPAATQVVPFGTGGILFPSGDFDDLTAGAGWLVSGGFGFPVDAARNVALVAEAMYGSVDAEVEGIDVSVVGFLGHVEYRWSGLRTLTPFAFGGAGYLRSKLDRDVGESATGWQGAVDGGAGLDIPLGDSSGFLVGRYVHGFDETTFLNLQAGLRLALDDEGP